MFFKIPKGKSEAVNRERKDNIMTRRYSTPHSTVSYQFQNVIENSYNQSHNRYYGTVV